MVLEKRFETGPFSRSGALSGIPDIIGAKIINARSPAMTTKPNEKRQPIASAIQLVAGTPATWHHGDSTFLLVACDLSADGESLANYLNQLVVQLVDKVPKWQKTGVGARGDRHV
nr:hypothetical protein [Bradyrhizobium agreste]